MAYPSPRHIQFRRGNTAAVSNYVGYVGEITVNIDDWTIRVSDGVTPGGHTATVNTASIIDSITDGNITFANLIPKANSVYSLGSITSQWKHLFVSNNTIYIGGTAISVVDGNLTVGNNTIVNTAAYTQTMGYTNYSNVNLASYLGGSVTIGGNLTVQGNLFLTGNTTLVSTNNLIINDNIIYIANANPGSSLDIGLVGHFTSTAYQHTGLVRQATSNQWQLFSNVIAEPGATIDFTNAIYDDIRVGNITSPTITGINANVTAANVGIKGYIDLANTIQSGQVGAANLAITSANVGMKGYVDLANTIQSAQLTAANTAWQANSYQQQALIGNLQASAYSNVNVAAYLSTQGIGGGNYSNVNVAAYLTTNSYLTSNLANLTNYAYASNVTTANTGIKGYVDLANTIQSAQVGAANLAITAANVGMLGYVNSQSFYSNAKVATYLQVGNISNVSVAGNVTASYFVGNGALLTGIAASSNYSNVQVAQYLQVGNIANISVAGNVTATYFVGNGALLTGIVSSAGTTYSNTNVIAYLAGSITTGAIALNASGGMTTNQTTFPLVNATATTINFGGAATTLNMGAATVAVSVGSGAGNITAGNITATSLATTGTGGNISGVGAVVSSANLTLQAGVYTSIFDNQGNVTVPRLFTAGNIQTAGYLFGNGAFLTGIVSSGGGNYSNVDVRNFLKTGDGASRLIQGYYANIDLGATAQLFSFGATAKSYFGHDGTLGNTSINYIRADNGDVRISTNNAAKTWTFDNTGLLTFAGTLTNGATFDGNDFTAAPNSFVEFAGYTGNTYVGLDNDSVFIQTNWNTAGKQWTFATDGTTLFPNQAIDGGTAPIELKSRSWSQLTYNNSDMNQQPNKNHSTTFYVECGDALLEIFRWDSGNVMQHRQWTFSSDGSLSLPDTGSITFPDNTVQTTAYTGAGSSYSNVQVATYLPTYSGNIANIRLGVAGVLTFADGTTQTTAGVGGGTNYSNSNVASYLISSNATFIGNTGNVSSVYPLQSNITQVFIGPQTALASGNANVTTTSWLLNNLYFNSVGNLVVRNTQTGYSYMHMGGAAGIMLGGLTSAATANANVGVLAPWATISSTGVTTTGTTTTNGITTTAALAVNSALGITSNQATQLIFNQTVTTITMGTGAATTINLGTTAAPTSNVFVGGTLGTNVYGLTLRANGQFNLVTSLNSSGGYGTATYTGIPVTGGSGNGMIISMTGVASGYLSTASITNPGTGYRSGDAITIPAGNPVGSLGGSFVLQNYHATRSNIGTGIWQLGIDGNLTLAGNVIFPSNSYIFGDFSNATVNSRTVFAPSAANASPGIYAVPSGTATGASWQAANSGNLTAASKILIATNGSTDVQLVSGINGSGTYLPLSFYNNGAAQMQLTVSGNLEMTTNNDIITSGVSGYFIGNSRGTTAEYTGQLTAANVKLSPSGNIQFADGTAQTSAYSNVNLVANLRVSSVIVSNLTVLGALSTTLNIGNSFVSLSTDNIGNANDIGFYGQYNAGQGNVYTGLAYTASDGMYRLFSNLTPEPSTTINTGSLRYSNIQVGNILAANVTVNTVIASNVYVNGGVSFSGIANVNMLNASGNLSVAGNSALYGNTTHGTVGAVSGAYHTFVGNITQVTSGGAVGINTTGNISASVANFGSGNVGGFAIGYRDMPQITAANLTLIAGDAGKHYYATNTSPTTLTIPLNSSVAFALGTVITVVNQGTGNITISRGTATLYFSGNSTNASRTITSYGVGTLLKVATDTWFINGNGVV